VDEGGRFDLDISGRADLYGGQCGGLAGEAVIRLVLSQPAAVTVETHGADYDTVLYARANCGADPADELACDDDGGVGLHSRLVLDLVPGTWFFFVDGFGAAGGRTQVRIDVAPRGGEP